MLRRPTGFRPNIYRVSAIHLQGFGQTSTGFQPNIYKVSAIHLLMFWTGFVLFVEIRQKFLTLNGIYVAKKLYLCRRKPKGHNA